MESFLTDRFQIVFLCFSIDNTEKFKFSMHNCISQTKLCRMAFDTDDCVLFGFYQNINQPLESGKSGFFCGWK